MQAAKAPCVKLIWEYGSILCPQVQSKIFDRSFNLQDPADGKAFEDAGAHSDPSKCMSIVGNAARWTLEILIENGVITPWRLNSCAKWPCVHSRFPSKQIGSAQLGSNSGEGRESLSPDTAHCKNGGMAKVKGGEPRCLTLKTRGE